MSRRGIPQQDRKPRRGVQDRWDALAAAIEANAILLATQGDLILKKNSSGSYWYLRFLMPPGPDGHRRHRALYVGRQDDQELVARVRALLERIRGPRRVRQELTGYVRIAAEIERSVQRSLRSLAGGADA
jgi:hypothetical protein